MDSAGFVHAHAHTHTIREIYNLGREDAQEELERERGKNENGGNTVLCMKFSKHKN